MSVPPDCPCIMIFTDSTKWIGEEPRHKGSCGDSLGGDALAKKRER